MMSTPDLVPSSALDEETARSELYGLLALLYYAPAAGAFLEEPWRALVGVARAMSEQDIQNEYNVIKVRHDAEKTMGNTTETCFLGAVPP